MLKEMIGLMGDLEKAIRADPKLKEEADLAEEVHGGRFHAMAYLATLGDKATSDALESQAKWDPSADGVAAGCALSLSQWLEATGKSSGRQPNVSS